MSEDEEYSRIFSAARDGRELTLCALLYNKDEHKAKRLLSRSYSEGGQVTTPFLIAARNGHHKVVKLFITLFCVDIEQTGTVKFDGFTVEQASALWCASGGGFLETVRTLVEHGANVNQSTSTNSTPLRAACFDGHLNVVRYLVKNSADIDIPNKFNNTCLMIASYRRHTEVVSYLLREGTDPDVQANCGATAMHFAAERGCLPVIKELVKFGGQLLPNEQQMTPLHVACDCSKAEIVEFFISRKECCKKDRVEALELLGASYANDRYTYDIDKCYHYFWLAMKERFSDSKNILAKTILPPIKAYGNRQECISIQELEAIKNDTNALHMEALIIRERLLGEDNVEIPHGIVFRGAVFADTASFEKCIHLWLRALILRQKNKRTISKDLLRFAQVFSQMLHVGVDINSGLVLEVFEHNLVELGYDAVRVGLADTAEEKSLAIGVMEGNILAALYLLTILSKLKVSKDEEHSMCMKVYRLNKMDLRFATKKNQTLLHAVCDEDTQVDDFHVSDIVKLPSDVLIKLLLKCGADPNAVDDEKNTPLHVIARYNKPISDFLTLHNAITLLLSTDCHLDRVNIHGETALDTTTTGVAEMIMKAKRKLSLKCIAARVVKEHSIAYAGIVPDTLKEFVDMH